MSTQDDQGHPSPHEREQVLERESASTPGAVEEADVAKKTEEEKLQKHRAKGVEWVRMSDLMSRHTSSVAGRGIDLHTELTHRVRDPLLERAKALARKLPPVSAFGRRGGPDRGPTRSGVGMP
jgi:hypothetical protein